MSLSPLSGNLCWLLEAKFDYKIEQLDIITALLEFFMEKIVYVEQPHIFEKPKRTSCV